MKKEPQIYQAHDRRGQYTVTWYTDEGRKRKTFCDGAQAELFRKKKLFEHLGQNVMLKEITTYEKYVPVPVGRIAELEAENARLRDVEAENTSLRDKVAAATAKNARLLAELESVRNQRSRRWVNNLALEWALDQELPTGLKAVLVTFAAHSDEQGESWPSVKYIGKKWKMARETVRTLIRTLNADKLLIDTGRRAGDTHQVKIHRLPEMAIEGVAITTPFKGAAKGRQSGSQSGSQGVAITTPNNDNEQEQEHHQPDASLMGTSVLLGGASHEGPPSGPGFFGFVVEDHHHQSCHSAREDIKWPEFATWCESQKGKPGKDGRVHDGIPTEKGFWKWLGGQKPEWRDKQSQIDGYMLDGKKKKFLTHEEANQALLENPKLMDEGRFLPARKMQTSDGDWWVEDEAGTTIWSKFLSEKR
jgi:hypothetical protein